jgi:hypothetical protein
MSMQRNHINIGRGMITHMTNANSQKTPAQSAQGGGAVESQKELAPDEISTTQDSNRAKKALSKREIMEQLSRERFPWDE